MIRFIQTVQTLPLRSLVLREGLAPERCYFEADTLPTTFHLGYFNEKEQLVCVLTCQYEDRAPYTGSGYRLRGMATHPDHERKGYARALLIAAMQHLQEQCQAKYLWFNARVNAFPFYESLNFEFISDEFDIPGIGPHRTMYKEL